MLAVFVICVAFYALGIFAALFIDNVSIKKVETDEDKQRARDKKQAKKDDKAARKAGRSGASKEQGEEEREVDVEKGVADGELARAEGA